MLLNHPIYSLISRIESDLASYYGFDVTAKASDCLLPLRETTSGNAHRGRMLVLTEGDEVMLGIEFSSSVAQAAEDWLNPTQVITGSMVSALLVVIEEVSHFQLLTQRASLDLSVTQLELEWQAEVDKLVLLPDLVAEKGARIAKLGLRRVLTSSFTLQEDLSVEDSARYIEATRFLTRLLGSAHLLNADMKDPELRAWLRKLYRMSWNNKTTAIAA